MPRVWRATSIISLGRREINGLTGMLIDHKFTDLYLGETASWIVGAGGASDSEPTPGDCADEIQQLRQRCQELTDSHEKREFSLRLGGISYRVSTLRSLTETVYVLRRFPATVPALATLGLHPAHVNRLMMPRLTGLIVVSGAFCQGKTTTGAAMVRDRLTKFGGVAITIEDPPEMPLEGIHGNGVCYQTEVEQGQFGAACRYMARWAPSIIFLSEARDPETAAEALRASINGRLVICTTHADSVAATVERLYSLANGTVGNAEDTSRLLAGGLTAVVHQSLEVVAEGVRRPREKFLWLAGQSNKGIQNIIRQRRFEQIENEVVQQFNSTLMQKSVPVGMQEN